MNRVLARRFCSIRCWRREERPWRVWIALKSGVTDIKFIGLIAAPEGIAALQNVHPDVDIYVAEIDSHLNNIGYIVPGLGDAGDRQFGTSG